MDDTWTSAARTAFEAVGESNADDQAVERLATIIEDAAGMTHKDRIEVAMTDCMGTERDAFLDWVQDSAEYCTGCGEPVANEYEECGCHDHPWVP